MLHCQPSLAKHGDTDLELQQRLGAIGTPEIGGTGSASLPSGCAKSFARTPPQNQHRSAQNALAHPANRARVLRSPSDKQACCIQGAYRGYTGGIQGVKQLLGRQLRPTSHPKALHKPGAREFLLYESSFAIALLIRT